MYNIRELAENFKADKDFRGSVLNDEPLFKHTTMRVGGPASLFLSPSDSESLVHALSVLKDSGFSLYCGSSILSEAADDDSHRFFILGGGSNLVVADEGFAGVVIYTGALCGITKSQNHADELNSAADDSGKTFVSFGAGASVASVVSFCTANSLSGIEQFAGLPGSAGGALFMNARCFDKSISDILVSAEYIDSESLKTCHYKFNAADWDYKKSPFQKTGRIIIGGTFALKNMLAKSDGKAGLHCELIDEKKVRSVIASECQKYIDERISKGHFKYPSAGSVFKNNHAFGKPSGKIIDECGLRGYSIGGAQIAPFHGNFIINKGNAKASEIAELVDYTVKQVKSKTGFTLEPEIIFFAFAKK